MEKKTLFKGTKRDYNYAYLEALVYARNLIINLDKQIPDSEDRTIAYSQFKKLKEQIEEKMKSFDLL